MVTMGSILPPPFPSKFYDMIFAQSTSSSDSSVMILLILLSYDDSSVVRSLFIYSLYDLCQCCPQAFLAFLLNAGGQQIRSQMNQPPHEARAHNLFKLHTKTLMYPQRYTTFFFVKTIHHYVKSSVVTTIRTDWSIC